MAKSKVKVITKEKKVKKNKKKEEELDERSEIRNLLKTVIIVLVSFLVCYLLFMLMGKLGMFEKGYEKPESGSNEFTYNTAIIGTVFNRPESEYYVSFDEEDGNTYFDTLLNMYKGSLHIYKVNMSLGINASNKGEKGNYNATKSSELVISGPTLIKIKDGRIVKYLEDLDKIKEELNN